MSGRKISVVVVGVCFIVGCVAGLSDRNVKMYSVAAESWIGQLGSEMRQAWGAPSKAVASGETDDVLGESAVLMVWEYDSGRAAEPAVVSVPSPSQAPTAGGCASSTVQPSSVPTPCPHGSTQIYYDQAHRAPSRHCKVTAKVVGGVVTSVQVENRRCHLTDEEFLLYAKPGTPLPE